jgi:hypothetical protein
MYTSKFLFIKKMKMKKKKIRNLYAQHRSVLFVYMIFKYLVVVKWVLGKMVLFCEGQIAENCNP